jgi:hypothetical protein
MLLTIPAPERFTVSFGSMLNVAVRDVFLLSTTLQTPVPLQAPLQPIKPELLPTVAVNVIGVLASNFPLQLEVQFIPAGLLATVPDPFPGICKAS